MIPTYKNDFMRELVYKPIFLRLSDNLYNNNELLETSIITQAVIAMPSMGFAIIVHLRV